MPVNFRTPSVRLPAAVRARGWLLVLAAIFVLALAPRVVIAERMDDPPTLSNDAGWYDSFARSIAQGKGYSLPFGEPTSQWPPGYPFFLGGIYKATTALPNGDVGAQQQAGRYANAVLGALTAVLAAELGRRLFSKPAGALAGVIMAIAPSHALFSALLLSEVLFTLLLTAAILVGVRARTWQSVVAMGALLGAATLVRSQGILLVIAIAAAWAAWGWWRPAEWRRSAALLGVALATVVLAIVPWTVRNAVRMDAFVPVSTNFGINIWIGNHPGATGGFHAGGVEVIERQVEGLPRPEVEIEYDRVARREALLWIRAEPIEALKIADDKIKETYKDDTAAVNWYQPNGSDYLGDDTEDRLNLIANSWYYAVLAVAGLGLLLMLIERARGAVLLVSAVVIWSLVSVVFFGEPRFHIPVLPLFAVAAGYGVARVAALAASGVRRVFTQAGGVREPLHGAET